MPAIHTKTKWEHGSGDLITFKRNPAHYYLRVAVPGTNRYQMERIANARNIEEAQTEAIGSYARLLQPKVIVSETSPGGRSAGFPISLNVTTTKNAKGFSRPLEECVKDYLHQQMQRVEAGEITDGTYKQRDQTLLVHLLPYLMVQGVRHTRELRPTTFEDYNHWRRTTSKSKITRNIELRVFRHFFTYYLLKRKLIDPDLLITPGFLPYQTIKGEDLDANPAIGSGDWRLIVDELHRYVAEANRNNNYKVGYFRTLFWSFCLVMKNTGIRPCELLRLKWKHIEFATEEKPDGSIRHLAHIVLPAPITKTGNAREVPTAGSGGDRLMSWLEFVQDHCDQHKMRRPNKNDLVFGVPHRDWKVPDYAMFSTAWRRIRRKLQDKFEGHKFSDRPYTIYSMRSTFIEDRLLDRVDAWLIARWCGHDVKMLMKHYEQADVRRRSEEATRIHYGKPKQVDATIKAEDYL